MEISSSGRILKPKLRADILQNYQEVECINQNYRQIYGRILKRWNLENKIAGIAVAKFSRGGVLKPKL